MPWRWASTPARPNAPCDLAPDDPQLLAYLRGNSLPMPGEAGWVLVTVAGYPLGWGKRSAGVIKNAYPRGLRWQG